MKQRCCNLNSVCSKNYGRRGIQICEEWLNSFEAFKEWSLSHGYSYLLSIDRINTNGNYSPSNCRWVTTAEQNRNRRDNRYITYDGITKTLTDWAREYNIGCKALERRVNLGWDIHKALTYPTKKEELKDLTGVKFGRLTVVSLAYIKNCAFWNCVCECGTLRIIRGANLTGGLTKSCGCIQKEKASKIARGRDYKKPIVQIDMHGKIIAEYQSPIKASVATGIAKSCIIAVANQREYKPGKTRCQAGGFKWKYKETVL